MPISSLTKCLALLIIFINCSLFSKPDTLVRSEIDDKYKWDFSHIYKNWHDWDKGFDQLKLLMDQYTAIKGTLSSGPDSILKAYQLDDEIGRLSYLVYRYPQLQRDVDTKDNSLLAKLQKVQNLFAKLGTETAWFEPELLSIPKAKMQKWIAESDGLKTYHFPIMELYRQQEHVLDEEGEKLLSYFSSFNSTPRSTFQQLSTADIVFRKVTFSDGKESTITYGEYISTLRTRHNQVDRRAAFEAFYETYAAHKNTYASIYDAILKRGRAVSQARNYSSVLEAKLDSNNIPISVVKNLIETVKKNVAPLRRYHQLRKKALGLEKYHLYDTSIPLVKDSTKYVFEDAVNGVLDSVKPFGDEYQNKMKKIVKGGFIDVYENEGKRGGAYSASVYGVSPYVLMNYNETLNNYFTLAHEMGHAMHTILSNETQPFVTSSYTIFIAEVASTMNEKLLLEYLLHDTENSKERIALLLQQIDNIVGTFYTQVMFADFELQAHNRVENDQPITSDILSEIYWKLISDYYGDVVTKDELYRYTWTRIPHFYNSPYYVYQYATCFASSSKLYNDINNGSEKDKEAALQRYLTLLRSGGNDHPIEQLKKAGVDLTEKDAVLSVVKELGKLVDRLDKEMAKVKL